MQGNLCEDVCIHIFYSWCWWFLTEHVVKMEVAEAMVSEDNWALPWACAC